MRLVKPVHLVPLALLVLLGHQDHLAKQVLPEKLVKPVKQALPVLLVGQGKREKQVRPARQEKPVLLGHQDQRVHLGKQELQVKLVLPVLQGQQALQA